MAYCRLYKIAREHINEIAEEMIEQISVYVIANSTKYYWTSDGEVFMNKQEAIDHQIKYLLEEIEE